MVFWPWMELQSSNNIANPQTGYELDFSAVPDWDLCFNGRYRVKKALPNVHTGPKNLTPNHHCVTKWIASH